MAEAPVGAGRAFVWVPVDVSGPIGAYATPEDAHKAIEPYLVVLWRGAIMRFQTQTEPKPGEEVSFVRLPDSPIPIFVGTTAEALAYHATFDGTGLLEDVSEMDYRKGTFGEMLPSARARLDPLLQSKERGDSAHNMLMRMMDADQKIGQDMGDELSANGAPEDFVFDVPVADFLAEMDPVTPASTSPEGFELVAEVPSLDVDSTVDEAELRGDVDDVVE